MKEIKIRCEFLGLIFLLVISILTGVVFCIPTFILTGRSFYLASKIINKLESTRYEKI